MMQRLDRMLTRITQTLHVVMFGFFTAACGGGGSVTPSISPTPVATNPTPTPIVSPTVTPDPETSVSVSGLVTFDLVPNGTGGGLDYDAIEARAVRGATVLALDASETPLASSSTDASGRYILELDRNISVSVRVLAELKQDGDPSWDFKVTDNTSDNAIYAMEGSLISTGNEDSTRDLHASSGWTGSSYEQARVAAPFAILNSIYDALQLVLTADPNVDFAAAELRWSVDNTAVSGSRSEGLIGTSFYDPNENNMYILGDDNNDTDEYDRSVILHEWAHYFEDTLSRSDSIGGSHTLGGAYDMRVAFGEGFANAFSSIAGGTPTYSDSAGVSQALGFEFSLEQNNVGNLGWFSENSVSKIVYDIADNIDDSNDNLSLGFTPIYEAMTSDDYVFSSAATSIYLFSEILKDSGDNAIDASIDALMQGEDIFGTGIYGIGETNDSAANLEFILPVYQSLSLGGTVNVCGNNGQGEYNGVDVRRFVRINIPSSGSRTITAVKTLGTGDRDPDFIVSRTGGSSTTVPFRQVFDSGVVDTETGEVSLSSGEYIVEVYDFLNADDETGGGSSCFDLTIVDSGSS